MNIIKIDLGFHYPNWQFSNTGDGNTLSADLDDNLRVDFNDFAVLANYWRQSTTSQADIDASGYVDYNDLMILASQWLQNADPNIQLQITGDPNNGYVDVGVSGYSFDTMRVFLLVNGEFVREIFGFEEGEALTIDISEFGPGNQQFKIVSIDSSGHLTCSNIANVSFSRPLNFCFLPETYIKNQTLPFAAYNSSEGNASVKVYANGGDVIWSQNFSGSSIFGFIPAEVLNDQNDIDFVSFEDSNGQSFATIFSEPQGPSIQDTRALIILPDRGIRIRDYRTIADIKKAFKDRGVAYNVLWGKAATYYNIAFYGWMGTYLKYMFIDAHGNYHLWHALDDNWTLRTVIYLYDGRTVSMRQSDFPIGQAPSWCQDLEYFENRTKSFYSMGFTHLEFVFSNSCYGGHLKINSYNQLVPGQSGQQGLFDIPYSDMSIALGMSDSSRDSFYQGWWGESWGRVLWDTKYQAWNRFEWQKLGEGEDLYSALYDTIWEYPELNDPNAPINNYRLSGMGFLWDITLTNW